MAHNPEAPLDQSRPTLLLTRPLPQSRQFADAFRARFGGDWPIIIAPLSDIRYCDASPMPDAVNHIVFTSQNGVASFVRQNPRRNATAWCVGHKTGLAANKAGFAVSIGPGTAAELADQIIAYGTVRKVFYPRGEHIAFDMAGSLKSAGIETIETIVYRQEPQPPSSEALRLVSAEQPVLVPLYSQKAAALFQQVFPEPVAPILVAAISEEVATTAATIRKKDCIVARQPDTDHMLLALAELISRNESP